MIVGLHDNSGAITTDGPYAGFNQITADFSVPGDTPVVEPIYYAGGSGSQHTPWAIVLYRSDTATHVRTWDGIANSPGVGWHAVTLGSPLTLLADVPYRLAFVVSAGRNLTFRMASGLPAAPAPFVFASPPGKIADHYGGMPTSAWAGVAAVGFRVEVGDPPPGPGGDGDPPTNASVTARLAQWLSSDPLVNERQGDLPWTTFLKAEQARLEAAAAQNGTELILEKMAIPAGATLWPLLQSLATTVGLAAVGATVENIVNNILGPARDQTIHERLTLLEQQVAAKRAPQDVVPMSDSGWVAATTIVGSGSYHCDVPADRYVLTITEYGSLRPYNVVGTVPYWLHRGWWATIDDDRIGHYHPIAGHKHMLYEVGQRLPGVLLGLDSDLEWTLTPYNYVA